MCKLTHDCGNQENDQGKRHHEVSTLLKSFKSSIDIV